MILILVQGWVEGQDANSLGLHPAGQLHLRPQPLHPELHVQPQWSAGQTWQVLNNVGWKGKLSQIVTVIKQHEGKIARIKKIESETKKNVTYESNHNQSITRHNKTGGLYNHSDPSTYDPTFDTIFNGPSINPCKLVILQIEWCQASPQNSKIKELSLFSRYSGSVKPSFPFSLCFGAFWWWSCWLLQRRIWTAIWKGTYSPKEAKCYFDFEPYFQIHPIVAIWCRAKERRSWKRATHWSIHYWLAHSPCEYSSLEGIVWLLKMTLFVLLNKDKDSKKQF